MLVVINALRGDGGLIIEWVVVLLFEIRRGRDASLLVAVIGSRGLYSCAIVGTYRRLVILN